MRGMALAIHFLAGLQGRDCPGTPRLDKPPSEATAGEELHLSNPRGEEGRRKEKGWKGRGGEGTCMHGHIYYGPAC